MGKLFLLFLLLLSLPNENFSQAPVRRLPSAINHPSLNLYAPYVSSDGNALVFVSDNGADGALNVSYTFREQDWSPPADMPKTVHTKLNFLRGYALSADGKRLYTTSAKSPVVGGYDIFVSEWRGSSWSNPENMLLPVNSKANDACPSVTTDGNTIYFMRCDRMDPMKADGCKIFRTAKKPNGQWQEPEELPASINTGNSQTPRIMADGETLIFSSDKMGGKGGMDLFQSRLVNGAWTAPVPLDFANTEKDDQYVSVTALGRYLLKEGKGARKNSELTEFLIPQPLRPKGLMKVEGLVKNFDGTTPAAYISVRDLGAGRRIHSSRPAADGSFSLYLKEGSSYELSVDPEQSDWSYSSFFFDLTSDKLPQKEKVSVVLKKPDRGDEFPLHAVQFAPDGSTLGATSTEELKKLARMIKANPTLRFEIQVLLEGYREDSTRSDPDLTEMTAEAAPVTGDSTLTDTTAITRVVYHNDRTAKQAQAILDYLYSQGVNSAQLTTFVNARVAEGTTRKVTVKAIAR